MNAKKSAITIHPIGENEPIKKEIGQLSLDIFHDDREIIVLAPIAGVIQEDIKISVTDDVLVIKGKRPARKEVSEENYYTRECFWGDFSRSIVLPQGAETKKISASFENGILEIHIPRTEKEQTQIIKIKS
ncbi:Hsp20/alpha crystallin family protein [Candidatus Peregrinibacteria bacterium]|nr:Hsp20/alpha crystallin family protein [Candidatus Peregrinibacteria bacterium]